MKATIWHNPKCGTSRKTLALLEEAGADVTIVDYIKTPPTADTLAGLYARAGMTVREGLRAKEPAARLLIDSDMGDNDLLAAMVADPILIERPLVETEYGVRLCRPQERVREIL